MSSIECRCNLIQNVQRAYYRQRTLLLYQFAQIYTDHQAHVDEQLSINFTDVMDGNDVRLA